MNKRDGERIVILETKMDELTKRMVEIGTDVKEIKDKVSNELIDHRQFEDRLFNLERGALFWRWVVPTMSAIAGSIMTYLIIEYFRTH